MQGALPETEDVSAVSMLDVALSCPSQLEEEDDEDDDDDGGDDDDDGGLSSPKDNETNLISVDFEVFGKVQGEPYVTTTGFVIT